MTSQQNQPNDNDTCNTGLYCAECCELIPTGSGHEIDSREVGDVVYHFCGPQCYQRWQERGEANVGPN